MQQHAAALQSTGPASSESRRLLIDVQIQAAIGRFFANKLQSGVLWEIFEQSQEPAAGQEAVKAYRKARKHWAEAARIGQVYIDDLSYGPEPWLRGHWHDRLPRIDADVAEMERLVADTNGAPHGNRERVWAAIGHVLAAPAHREATASHSPPASFKMGSDLTLVISNIGEGVRGGRLHYRHVNQAETWQSLDLLAGTDGLVAVIPADYTRSRFALQYYFELRGDTAAALFPGLASDLANQPYFVIRRAT